MTPAVHIQNLTVSYQAKPVLWNIDVQIPAGKLVGIIGQNGSGKTTLINTIMGLIKPMSGSVSIFDEPLAKMRKRVSYVPQRESVDWDFPATVTDVVKMGRYVHTGLFGRFTATDYKKVAQSLERVGMSAYADRQIGQLSGGQKQRVFIARALAQEADLYFMDEPFAGVDAGSEADILAILGELRAQGKTIIIVHHDLATAYEYFDWAVLLNTRLVASGPMREVLTPENLKDTYGGKLTVLSELAQMIRQKNTK